jgi:hypothetical protein
MKLLGDKMEEITIVQTEKNRRKPHVSLSKSGYINFNDLATKHYGVTRWCRLSGDKETKVLGIHFVTEAEAQGLKCPYKVALKPSGVAQLNVTQVLKAFNLQDHSLYTIPTELIEGTLVLNLSTAKVKTRRSRKKVETMNGTYSAYETVPVV